MKRITELVGLKCRNGKGRRIPQELIREGIMMKDAYTGNWAMEHLRATVRMEENDVLRIRAAIEAPENPVAAFEQQGSVSGNVRYGIARDGWQVVADTRLNGVAHLTRSLNEIQDGFHRLTGKATPSVATTNTDKGSEPLERKLVEDHLNRLAEETVEINSGWEVRPRCEGVSVPVELCLTSTGARCRSAVLSHVPNDLTLSALVHQALRFNHQLRFCRLTIDKEQLVAESTLHSQLMESSAEWLQIAIRAVATARHRLRDPLSVLAEQTEVARCYVELFLNN